MPEKCCFAFGANSMTRVPILCTWVSSAIFVDRPALNTQTWKRTSSIYSCLKLFISLFTISHEKNYWNTLLFTRTLFYFRVNSLGHWHATIMTSQIISNVRITEQDITKCQNKVFWIYLWSWHCKNIKVT